MIRGILVTAVLIGAAYLVVNSLPDVARYLKMRDM
jgi:hypothetical protein